MTISEGIRIQSSQRASTLRYPCDSYLVYHTTNGIRPIPRTVFTRNFYRFSQDTV